jgi:nucleoside-diphosphate-sugar epimerase
MTVAYSVEDSMTQAAAVQTIQTIEQLEDALSKPTEHVVETMRRMEGDILLLGVAGKIGPSLARMAKRASDLAGVRRRVIGVSRFSNERERQKLESIGVETIRCDLLGEEAIAKLPQAANLIYLAGLKFGSSDCAAMTWAMNTYLPAVVARTFTSSRIVAYSTGAVYGMSPIARGGSREGDELAPIGEYAMSCLGRERMFEYFSGRTGLPIAIIRLFYACELRYGVLVDLARMVHASEPIDVSMSHFNVIWQGDNNAMTLRAVEHTSSPPRLLNITGPELLSIREVATEMGAMMGRKPAFIGEEQETTCVGDSSLARELLGAPTVSVNQMIQWVVDWVSRGGECLGKPTHFEVRDGRY